MGCRPFKRALEIIAEQERLPFPEMEELLAQSYMTLQGPTKIFATVQQCGC